MNYLLRFFFLAIWLFNCGYTGREIHTPKVIAHRGVSIEAPENTLSAFAKAISIGADAIEMDVHLTADGVPIIIHDGILGRTTDGAFLKKTTEVTLKEIKSLDAGIWFDVKFKGESIPTLDEVFQLVNNAVPLMVEIKKDNSSAEVIVDAVLKSLQNFKTSVILGSFEPLIIEEILKKAPELPVIGIIEEADMLKKFREMPVKHLAIWYPLLSSELIQQLHNEGIDVWAFTIDNPRLAHFLASIKIDGIITNNSREIQRVFQPL